jgi:2-haloacid dehalogenase
MHPILAFDVNETLLDLAALDPHFERSFGSAAIRKEWFTQALQLVFVSTLTGAYSDFGKIFDAALGVIEERHQKPLASEQRSAILGTVSRLPAHRDVSDGLQRLRDGGFRLVALTNSTALVANKQLEQSGLKPYFERIFSADSVQRLKPAPEPYRMVAREMGVQMAGLWLVAAHAWDVTGAKRAGCGAAFIARPGQILDSLAPKPDLIATDLADLASQLLKAREAA